MEDTTLMQAPEPAAPPPNLSNTPPSWTPPPVPRGPQLRNWIRKFYNLVGLVRSQLRQVIAFFRRCAEVLCGPDEEGLSRHRNDGGHVIGFENIFRCEHCKKTLDVPKEPEFLAGRWRAVA